MIDTCRPVLEITMDDEHGLEVERQETANGNRVILLTPVPHILARFCFPQTATARTILKYYVGRVSEAHGASCDDVSQSAPVSFSAVLYDVERRVELWLGSITLLINAVQDLLNFHV